ncbi:MAG: hypothetical protein JWR19_3671 [Pedosphaera sp.]|nr:hypothetical protein [Pedosphaera sp.]
MSKQPIPETCPAERNAERAAPRSPIWPCTRWGFPCLRDCSWSGGLLPHLFTLTTGRSRWRFNFLWHFPSKGLSTFLPSISHASRQRLRGIAPCGVRTFLLRLAPKATLRPSKIKSILAHSRPHGKQRLDSLVRRVFHYSLSTWELTPLWCSGPHSRIKCKFMVHQSTPRVEFHGEE